MASGAPAAARFPHPDDRAYLLLPAGARGPAFLMLQNFRVIMKYNPAEAYALAIGHLADRLRGGGSFVQNWPRDERVLTLDERYEMQQLLARRGFDIGEPDGLFWSAHPHRHPQFPSLDRADSRWVCLDCGARAAASALRPLNIFKPTLFQAFWSRDFLQPML